MARALEHYRAGRMADATRIYEAILAGNPRDADALHLLGVVSDAGGDPALAYELIGRALAIRDMPSYHSNLGMVLGHLGRHKEALACYERALGGRPDYPEAFNNLGVSLEALRRFVEAEGAYRKAIAARPGYAEAWGNLGNTLRSLGRLDEAVSALKQSVACSPSVTRAGLGYTLRAVGRTVEAEAAFRHDVAMHPDSPDTLNNLAAALNESPQNAQAVVSSAEAAAQRPDSPEACANLGQVLHQLNRLEEAAAISERALALRPDYPEALTNLGNAQRDLGRLEEAETTLRRALALRPTEIGAYNNLAITFQAQDRPYEALAVLDLAAALNPNDSEIQHHRAMLLLRQGRLREGWDGYEWRFRTKQAGSSYARYAGQPRWHGEDLDGHTILLVPEQGFGDTIQFVRYAPLVVARGGRVLIAVQKPLDRLLDVSLDRLGGVARVNIGEPMPAYDVHCRLLSLPRIFETTLDTIPASIPYLHPEPEAVARWAARLYPDKPGLRVGVVWAGNPRHIGDRQRSLPFAALAPLWRVPGIRWFGLQLGDRAADLARAEVEHRPHAIDDLSSELSDFADTAAAMAGLDLVISADTAVAHLAGATGRLVWVLLPAVPDWRWLRSGRDSPWYPTMRLFRQNERRSWAPVLEAVADALAEHTCTA